MFSQRAMSRAATQRFAAQLRPQSIRTPFQRRFASSESGFTGAEDNAFNRERKAVKDHAAATSACLAAGGGILHDDWQHRKQKLIDSNSVTIPCLLIASVNAYNLWEEHWAHWNHMAPLEERPEYPYQNIRTKNFFWGDGDKASVSCGPSLEREGQLPQEARVDMHECMAG
ncbi:hypothetical protein ACMFMG_009398 [Clarireedia jacksonii]